MLKSWGIHSVWIIGILVALLIGTLSVDWVGIKDLPGIISFAVGLSSLILAVIAIFQTLSSTGSVESSLSAVREATASSSSASNALTKSSEVIHRAATDAQTASAAALNAIVELKAAAGAILDSSAANINAIAELQESLKSKQSTVADDRPTVASSGEPKEFKKIAMGGAAILYAMALSLKKKRTFRTKDIFPADSSVQFEQGYIHALRDVGFASVEKNDDGSLLIERLSWDPDLLIAKVKGASYSGATGDDHAERMSLVKAYFVDDEVAEQA
jgi:hypothetical protein